MSPKLQSDEELVHKLRPHPLAFYKLYLIWTYLTLVGIYFMTDPQIEISYVNASPEALSKVLWWLSIFVPAVLIALFRINWRWLLALALPALLAFYLPGQADYLVLLDSYSLTWFANQNHILIAFGMMGILGTEVHRRSHRYYITSWRLVMESGYFGMHRRVILYKNINDLVVEQSIVGRIFNFGSIVPITASGLGLGDDFSIVGASAGNKVSIGAGGGKTISTPRGRSYHQLEGIPHPNEINELIISLMHNQI